MVARKLHVPHGLTLDTFFFAFRSCILCAFLRTVYTPLGKFFLSPLFPVQH
jgi:hypothetical protein